MAPSHDLPAPLERVGDSSWREHLARALARAPDPRLAAAGFARLLEAGSERSLVCWPTAELDDLAVVLGSSPALTRYLVRFDDRWPEAAAVLRETNPEPRELVDAAAIGADAAPDAMAQRLRMLAQRELYRIGARDLIGKATLDETLTAISNLADVSIDLATKKLRRHLARESGDVVSSEGRPVRFVVLGLGKLGGRELNYSSDVDLVYFYDGAKPADGCPDAHRFFLALAKEITRAIGEQTADGRVFRVDLRLRPEGHDGPLVNPVENALTYYEGWGDTWERGALAKVRPVGGDLDLGEYFRAEIRPFLYRRHLDYQTVEDLRLMKGRIDAEQAVQARGVRDVKLGSGGIRELEFIVQALQLIHGGHEPELQTTGTRVALAKLVEHGFLAPKDAEHLGQAYRFLRDVEHAVQVVEQRQSQRLPDDAAELRALARRLGYGTGRRGRSTGGDEVTAFEADWNRHTSYVRESFVRFLELRPDEAAGSAVSDPAAVALLTALERGERDRAIELLEGLGFPDGPKAADTLARLYRGRIVGPASPQRRRAVESMAPALLSAVAGSADPERALDRLVDFLIRTGAHTSYLALLGGSPATMELLVTLFATSPYLASHVVGHPELIDFLVRADQAVAVRTTAELESELDEMLADATDEESAMAGLRRFRNAETVRIGMQDLAGVLDLVQVHEQLSSVAEVALRRALEIARRLVAHSVPPPEHGIELAVVGLGKMGGREMGYGSDLDLLFVYDSAVEGFDGEAHDFATRWVQKAISLLQSRTRDGIVFAIDARLRPSGRSGPLVTSLARFVDYHRHEAELWERQAHIRARIVYGGASLGERIEAVITQFVYGRGLDAEEIAAIDTMRQRIERELAKEEDGKLNIKTGRGGIVDIEFMVQMLQLRYGHEHPAVRMRSTHQAIDALASVGALEAGDAELLRASYLFLRRLEARMRLERDRPVEELGTDPAVLAPLAVRLGFRGEEPGAQLLAEYERTREAVRRLYERAFSDVDV